MEFHFTFWITSFNGELNILKSKVPLLPLCQHCWPACCCWDPHDICIIPEIILILPGMLLILRGIIVTCWHRPYTVPPPHHDQNRGQTWKWAIFYFCNRAQLAPINVNKKHLTWQTLCKVWELVSSSCLCRPCCLALAVGLIWSVSFCDYIGLGEGSSDVLTFLHFSWAPGPPRWDSVGTWSPQNNSSSSRAPRCLTHS